MSKTTFKTNPVGLESLLLSCQLGKTQLPDFQRSWVWADDRIQGLIASVSRGFPIGALMTLATKPGATGVFASRPVQGAPISANNMKPDDLLLDGQQRMTSLYQTCMRREVVSTITPKNKLVKRWFYIDIQKAIQNDGDRDEAIIAVPEDRRIKTNFDKDVVMDLSKAEFEYETLMFPLNQVFDWDTWQDGYYDFWSVKDRPERREVFKQFKKGVLENFKSYQVPVIALDHDTTHEAVCLVFEKVNTGGKALDAFELLTAMYAALGHKLRDDWLGEHGKLGIQSRLEVFGRAADQSVGVLAKVASTDFLQAIALLHTKRVRFEMIANGAKENDLPAVRATRQSLLDLPLPAYLKYRDKVEDGFKKAGKFLRQQCIHRVIDLPYQSQLVPLAAIFAEIGESSEHASNIAKISQWFWCGIFGELYGGAIETRFSKDIVEVPNWLKGGPKPTTVLDCSFRPDRLYTMRTRLSAAYKGIHALMMRKGAKDFRSGQGFDLTVFFDERVDIHHIFPQAWCESQKIDIKVYDNVINKTPLAYRTNRIIGGAAPSKYLAKLEAGKVDPNGQIEDPPIDSSTLDGYLASHCIPVGLLRKDDFIAFMKDRSKALLNLISEATGNVIAAEVTASTDDGEELSDEIARDSEIPFEVSAIG